ncbi:DUF4013 domain-containing protein [Opitutales bacterium]|nr:DUF4013 domain-containing protein [Opitutales bacterium]
MKEKPIFEEVFAQLVSQPKLLLKVLLGSALSFVPILNFFAFGYLYRYAAQLRRSGQIELPEWTDWAGLFSDGLKFALAGFVYCLLPLGVALIFSLFLSALGLDALAYLLMLATFICVSVLLCVALYRLQMRSNYKDLFDVVLIVRMAIMKGPNLIVPMLVFAGICAVGLSFYGVIFFAGFLLLLTQTTLIYRALETAK